MDVEAFCMLHVCMFSDTDTYELLFFFIYFRESSSPMYRFLTD